MSRNGMRHRTGRKAGVANSLMQSSPTFWSSRGSWKGEAGGSCSRDQWICLPEFAEGLLPGPPNGVSPASHTQVGGWTVDPVCLLSSLCSHLHGDSAPSGAGQPAQVSHPSPPTPQTHGRLGLWGDFFGKGRSRILILHPFLLCGACIFRRLQCPVLSPDSLIPTIPSPKEKGKC